MKYLGKLLTWSLVSAVAGISLGLLRRSFSPTPPADPLLNIYPSRVNAACEPLIEIQLDTGLKAALVKKYILKHSLEYDGRTWRSVFKNPLLDSTLSSVGGGGYLLWTTPFGESIALLGQSAETHSGRWDLSREGKLLRLTNKKAGLYIDYESGTIKAIYFQTGVAYRVHRDFTTTRVTIDAPASAPQDVLTVRRDNELTWTIEGTEKTWVLNYNSDRLLASIECGHRTLEGNGSKRSFSYNSNLISTISQPAVETKNFQWAVCRWDFRTAPPTARKPYICDDGEFLYSMESSRLRYDVSFRHKNSPQSLGQWTYKWADEFGRKG